MYQIEKYDEKVGRLLSTTPPPHHPHLRPDSNEKTYNNPYLS